MADINNSGTPQAEKKHFSRRAFISSSAVAVGGAMVGAAPYSRVMAASSYSRIQGANDRIRLGIIGCGGMGTSHIGHYVRNDGAFAAMTNTEITAVSDVYAPRLERAHVLSGGKPFHHYTDLLGSGLVDGVIIASPEHWHYQHAKDAVDAGLDIYLQKAMTRTFEQAKSLHKVVSQSDRVFQLGSQYMQTPTWWRARELFQQGELGKITMCQTSYCRNSVAGEWNKPHDPELPQPGKNLDWDAWLGSLPKMDFNPDYFFNYRKYKPFSAGIITDLLPHKIHTLCYLIGPSFPRRVTCLGGQYVQHDRDVADTVVVSIEFDDYVMLIAGSTANETGLEDLIRGNQGNLYVAGNSVRMIPERVYADDFDPVEERLEPTPMHSHLIHQREWLDGVRSRKQPTWNIDASYKVMTAIAMAEQAYWTGKAVEFDAEKQVIL
jgi:predicted dehydrogenase